MESLHGLSESSGPELRVLACEEILGFPVTTADVGACLDLISEWLQSGSQGKYFTCINPHSVEIARQDRIFAQALREADMAVPDGVGIALASHILGGAIRGRITGSDVFWGLNACLNERGGSSAFFLGSTPQNLEQIAERMARDYPQIRVAGLYSPPFADSFTEEQSRTMIEAVNGAAPDVLWVGMTAPKQEKWIWQHRAQLKARFIGPVGAVFDFFTGRVQRSHPVFQRLGLEWLPRLLQEPRRLWRRNFVSNPRFLARVLLARMRRCYGP